MSRQLEQGREERQKREDNSVLLACESGLAAAVSRAGGELTGLGVRYSTMDVLITIKAVFPAGPQICFVGGETIGKALVKGMREAYLDRLKWRPDKYALPRV